MSSSPTPPPQPTSQSPFSGITLPGVGTATVNGGGAVATNANSVQQSSSQGVVLQQQTSVNNGYPQAAAAHTAAVAQPIQNNGYPQTPPPVAARAPPLAQRSHTVDSPAATTQSQQWYNKQKAPTLKELQQTDKLTFMSQQQQHLAQQQQQNGGVSGSVPFPVSPAPAQSATNATSSPWTAQPALGPTSSDPFDAAWATKSPNVKPPSSNPFQSGGDSVTQTVKMQL